MSDKARQMRDELIGYLQSQCDVGTLVDKIPACGSVHGCFVTVGGVEYCVAVDIATDDVNRKGART